MYSASVLLTTAMGLYWKRTNTPGTLASLCIAGTLPLTSIFLSDTGVLPSHLEWIVQDKLVGIITYIASFLFLVVGSLLTQASHPPKPLTTVSK